jgi:hypothetical protein
MRRAFSIALALVAGCEGVFVGGPRDRDAAVRREDGAAIAIRDSANRADVPRREYPPGEPGCGLELAAFCDTFDEVSSGPGEGRAGDLDPRSWSAARMRAVHNVGAEAVPVPPATVSSCRAAVPARVFPGQDVLVCDGNERIESRHLLVAAASQNYGQTSLRIRQPFDFVDRTGRVVFDLDGDIVDFLHGWPSIAITEDPSPAPSFGRQDNFENGAIPRAGIEIHFLDLCGGTDQVGVGLVNVFDGFEEHFYESGAAGRAHACVRTRAGGLNHFEILVSRSHVEVWGADVSENGIDFGAPRLIFALDVELPFEQGFVHLNTHNHATYKYSVGHAMDAWVTRWDNVGFDGPVVDDRREYSIRDSMIAVRASFDEVGVIDAMNVGYAIGENDPQQILTFENVDPSGVDRAGLALNVHLPMNQGLPYEGYTLRHRLNGGAWQDRRFTPEELAFVQHATVLAEGTGSSVRTGGIAGAMSLWIDLDPAALREGDNTIELATQGVPRNLVPVAANIDLVLRAR